MALSFSGSPITREFGFLTEHAEARSDDDRVRSRRRCLQAHTPDEVEAALNLWLCGWSGPGSHLTPEPRTSGAVQTIALVPIPDRIRGGTCGHTSVPLFVRSDLAAPTARARSERHRTHCAITQNFRAPPFSFARGSPPVVPGCWRVSPRRSQTNDSASSCTSGKRAGDHRSPSRR
jgi:hypothetical protein